MQDLAAHIPEVCKHKCELYLIDCECISSISGERLRLAECQVVFQVLVLQHTGLCV